MTSSTTAFAGHPALTVLTDLPLSFLRRDDATQAAIAFDRRELPGLQPVRQRVQSPAPARADGPPTHLTEDAGNANLLQSQPGRVEVRRFTNLERGTRQQTNAIVLHMTGGTAAGTLAAYARRDVGAHYLITKEGKIIQTASLEQETAHVGTPRPKGYVPTAAGGNRRVDGDLTPASRRVLDDMQAGSISFGEGVRRLARLEASKPYGNDRRDESTRGPINRDSIGIEFEARVGADGNYEALTPQQIAAGRVLVEYLQQRYGLEDADVYEHPDVSYKQYSEARGAAAQILAPVRPDR